MCTYFYMRGKAPQKTHSMGVLVRLHTLCKQIDLQLSNKKLEV